MLHESSTFDDSQSRMTCQNGESSPSLMETSHELWVLSSMFIVTLISQNTNVHGNLSMDDRV